MANKTKPANGSWRLTTESPATSVVYAVSSAGLRTTFGILVWVQDGSGDDGHFQKNGIGITFYDDGTFVAVNGSESFDGTWEAA